MVYAAESTTDHSAVAIKALLVDRATANDRRRFLREIEFEQRLSHAGIVPLIDSGEAAGIPYFVMPLIDGKTLAAHIARHRQLAVPEALRIVLEVADALAYAHDAGIVHRDVKPANILLGPERAVILDFGIGRALEHGDPANWSTTVGIGVGTPAYMSPEQASAQRDLDGRSDQYSLACLLYEMLAGSPPFAGTAESVRARQIHDPVPPLRTVRRSVPASLEAVIYRALSKSRADRYATMREFAAALEQVARDPLVSVVEVGWRRRRRAMLGVAAVALATVGVWSVRRVAGAAEARRLGSADTTRLVIFPVDGAAGVALAVGLDDELRRAFVRWKGIAVVDPKVVLEHLAKGESPSATGARNFALSQKARRYLRTSVSAAAGETHVRVTLHDAATPDSALAEVDGTLPGSGARRDSMLAALAGRVLVRNDAPALSRAAGGGTRSLPARQAYVGGVRAFDAWDLTRADSQFSVALKFDPDFAQASLGVALVRYWTNHRAPAWSVAANAANAGRSRLTSRERAQTEALLEVVAGRMPEACARWDALTRADTLDFAAWYGAAHCMARDNAVLPDARSPSGWRFRTSYRAALARYRRAFALHPAVLRALRDNAFEPVRRLLRTNVGDVRRGAAPAPDTGVFVAYATLVHDTLAFVPFPAAAFESSDPRALARMPATIGQALRVQRESFRDLATSWVAAEPQGLEAREAVAWSLLLVGDRAAIDSLVSARRLARTPAESLRVMATEAWMRAQVTIPDDLAGLRRAKSLADSVLRHARAGDLEPQVLAGVAALTGRGHRAAKVMRRSATPAGTGVPPALAPDAAALRTYAALGGPRDSLRSLERRLDSLVASTIAGGERDATRQRAIARAASLAFATQAFAAAPALASGGDYVLGAQAAWQRHDTAQVRAVIARLRLSRVRFGPADLTLDALLPEAELLCAIGDRTAAAAWLDPTLAALRLRATAIDPVHAATMVRALRLRGELAQAAGDSVAASRWLAPVRILWSEADAVLLRPPSARTACAP